MPRKQLKAQMKALKLEAKRAAKAAGAPPAPDGESETVTAQSQTDWSAPWWEDHEAAALAD
jgi:hypothetical protein